MKCLICNKDLKSHQAFCLHLRIHEMTIQKYVLDILKFSNKCHICNKPTAYTSCLRTFNRYCSAKCAANDPETKLKRKKTCLLKYGVENPTQNKDISEKTKQTCLSKYGVTTTLNTPQIRELTTKIVNENKIELLEKREKTNIEKYGTKCTLNTIESVKKKKETWMNNYGVEHPTQSSEVRTKTQQTCIDRYGVSNPLQSEIIYNKVIRTNMEKYGSSSAMHSPLIISKVLGSLFRSKPYVLPSGNVVKLLGYEPYFLDYVFSNKLLSEEEINYSPSKIKYTGYDSKIHYYFPDFYISKLNLIIEIKSKWTEKQDKNMALKENACRDNGFNYIRITNNNFASFLTYIQAKT